MNKKKFLNLLEEKLWILSEEERKDILNEYKDTIEEKVRHGSTEEQAVADFGSIEELSREILKAYKINPDYKEDHQKEKKDIVEESETLIKKGAQKLSDLTKKIVEEFQNNDREWTLEMVFEMMIKALILLILLALLRIPFYCIEYLGISIFSITFPPISSVLHLIWRIFVGFVYLFTCVVVVMIMFKPYFVSESSKKKTKKEIKKEKTHNKGLEIIKLILFILFVVPLYLVDFGCYIASIVLFFLLIQGLPFLGVFLICLSVSIFFTFFTNFFYQLLYGNKKFECYSLILCAILFVSGFFFTISTLSQFEFFSDLPENSFQQNKVVYKETITDSFSIPYFSYSTLEDPALADDQIEIEVTYYSDFVSNVREYQTNGTFHLRYSTNHLSKTTRKNLYNLAKEELKEYHWYQYQDLFDLDIVVKANQKTLLKIQ